MERDNSQNYREKIFALEIAASFAPLSLFSTVAVAKSREGKTEDAAIFLISGLILSGIVNFIIPEISTDKTVH